MSMEKRDLNHLPRSMELSLKNAPATAAVIRQARVAATSAFTPTAAML